MQARIYPVPRIYPFVLKTPRRVCFNSFGSMIGTARDQENRISNAYAGGTIH